jgi:flavin-dependent dehydrogenase
MYTDFELLRCGLGWVVDRGAFDASLLRFAAECGVRVSEAPTKARLVNSPRDHDASLIVTRDGEKWMAEFVVDATGAAGSLLPQGENRRARYDRLIAVRARLSVAPDPPDWMHLATSKAGWWYTLPATEGAAEAVFMTDSDLFPRDPIARWQHLTSEFRSAFQNMKASPVVADRVWARDARTTCRQRVWAGCWLPIGDARATIDPLTGAGLERALGFAEVGAELVADFLTSRSFRTLEANAIDFLHNFEASLIELRRRYKMAAEDSLDLNGLFWQRRCNVAGFRNSS